MTSQRVFQTESIDLTSFLATAGFQPTIYRASTGNRAVFEFLETEELQQAIVAYERGASLPAKRLLNARSWLFREASRVCREGVKS
jgi:hypothetical protein